MVWLVVTAGWVRGEDEYRPKGRSSRGSTATAPSNNTPGGEEADETARDFSSAARIYYTE